ncbi:molybdopterin-dependent oxidoreductase (plasmid) [Rhizobium grahamii]|uniref:Molybdopterin-dependent oxidoreductase n=2 Tax=Rhizobium grahamii TaxID=1120045 RepID=A0A5Q0CFP6_9HYPH|nr:molybdopterin-dependent oxidoreductase [Rhizobium grahamii]
MMLVERLLDLKGISDGSRFLSSRKDRPQYHTDHQWRGARPSEGPQAARDYICNVFGLDPKDITVKNAFVGGAFGAALRPKHQLFLGVMASLDLKRSVRVEMTGRRCSI